VIYRHALKNALNPFITLLGFEIASLLSGAALIEIIVNWPGMGMLMLDAVLSQDLYLVMGGLSTKKSYSGSVEGNRYTYNSKWKHFSDFA